MSTKIQGLSALLSASLADFNRLYHSRKISPTHWRIIKEFWQALRPLAEVKLPNGEPALIIHARSDARSCIVGYGSEFEDGDHDANDDDPERGIWLGSICLGRVCDPDEERYQNAVEFYSGDFLGDGQRATETLKKLFSHLEKHVATPKIPTRNIRRAIAIFMGKR